MGRNRKHNAGHSIFFDNVPIADKSAEYEAALNGYMVETLRRHGYLPIDENSLVFNGSFNEPLILKKEEINYLNVSQALRVTRLNSNDADSNIKKLTIQQRNREKVIGIIAGRLVELSITYGRSVKCDKFESAVDKMSKMLDSYIHQYRELRSTATIVSTGISPCSAKAFRKALREALTIRPNPPADNNHKVSISVNSIAYARMSSTRKQISFAALLRRSSTLTNIR